MPIVCFYVKISIIFCFSVLCCQNLGYHEDEMRVSIPDPNTRASVPLGQSLWQKVDSVVRVPYAFAPGACK